MIARYVMGTFLRVRVEAERAAAAQETLFKCVQDLEDKLSFYQENSDVSLINRAAGLGPVVVDAETFRAVAASLRYAELTGGAFDPTFRSAGGGRFRAVSMNPATMTVELREPGMVLDLGGIGKGFALDAALERVREEFLVSSMVMDFGGQWSFWSRKGVFDRETVLVEDPRTEGAVLGSLTIDGNCSVSTSSQSQRPGHLLVPVSGRAANGCLSATAIAATGTEAEALSTALFISGPDRAREVLAHFPGARAMVH